MKFIIGIARVLILSSKVWDFSSGVYVKDEGALVSWDVDVVVWVLLTGGGYCEKGKQAVVADRGKQQVVGGEGGGGGEIDRETWGESECMCV